MEFKKKRWIFYGLSLILIFGTGFQYSLSVFQNPLERKFGWGIPEIAAAYSILCLVELLVMVFLFGRLRNKLGIRKFLILGGLFFGGGLLLCSFISGSIWELYLYQGVMIGIGHAIVYPCLATYVIQIMPERAGLAGGLLTAVYACSSLIWAPLSVYISGSAGDLPRTFIVLGVILLMIFIIPALFLREPPTDYHGEAASPEDIRRLIEASAQDVSRREMIRMPLFYLFYVTYFIAILGGMMVLTQAATIFENGLGVSAGLAAILLGALSVCNAFGRLFCGGLFDKISPFVIVPTLFVFYVLSFGLMAFSGNSLVFTIAACLCVVSFGGFVAILAPLTSRLFGAKYLAENFALVFTLCSLAGIVAPVLVTNLKEWSGEYTLSFSIALGLSALGIFFSFGLKRLALRWAETQLERGKAANVSD